MVVYFRVKLGDKEVVILSKWRDLQAAFSHPDLVARPNIFLINYLAKGKNAGNETHTECSLFI